MARTKTDQNRAEHIVAAAEELFARYGYERTSIEDIAKHLGIGKGSVYIDFRTKDDILFKILEKHARFLMERMKQRIATMDESTSALETLRCIFRESSIQCYDRVTRDLHTPEALLHTSMAVKSRFSHFFADKRAMLVEVLKKAAAQGEIEADKATEDVALALMQATCSLFPPYLNNYSEQTATTIGREEYLKRSAVVIDILINGLRKQQ